MTAEWLERNITGGEVWYGGDSSGVCAKKFDLEARQEYITHWAEAGHVPYCECFDNGPEGIVDAPVVCSLCKVPMTRYGWGPQYAAYRCLGCEKSVGTHDGGKSWETTRKCGGRSTSPGIYEFQKALQELLNKIKSNDITQETIQQCEKLSVARLDF